MINKEITEREKESIAQSVCHRCQVTLEIVWPARRCSGIMKSVARGTDAAYTHSRFVRPIRISDEEIG